MKNKIIAAIAMLAVLAASFVIVSDVQANDAADVYGFVVNNSGAEDKADSDLKVWIEYSAAASGTGQGDLKIHMLGTTASGDMKVVVQGTNQDVAYNATFGKLGATDQNLKIDALKVYTAQAPQTYSITISDYLTGVAYATITEVMVKTQYTVSFDANYSTTQTTTGAQDLPSSDPRAFGATTSDLDDATLPGYTLASWNTKSDGTGISVAKDEAGDVIKATHGVPKLYAIWEKTQNTLNFSMRVDGTAVSQGDAKALPTAQELEALISQASLTGIEYGDAISISPASGDKVVITITHAISAHDDSARVQSVVINCPADTIAYDFTISKLQYKALSTDTFADSADPVYKDGKIAIANTGNSGYIEAVVTFTVKDYTVTVNVSNPVFGSVPETHTITNVPYGSTINAADTPSITAKETTIAVTLKSTTTASDAVDGKFDSWTIVGTSGSYILEGNVTCTAELSATVPVTIAMIAVQNDWGTLTTTESPSKIADLVFTVDYGDSLVFDDSKVSYTFGNTPTTESVTAEATADTEAYIYDFVGFSLGTDTKKILGSEVITAKTTYNANFTKAFRPYTIEFPQVQGVAFSGLQAKGVSDIYFNPSTGDAPTYAATLAPLTATNILVYGSEVQFLGTLDQPLYYQATFKANSTDLTVEEPVSGVYTTGFTISSTASPAITDADGIIKITSVAKKNVYSVSYGVGKAIDAGGNPVTGTDTTKFVIIDGSTLVSAGGSVIVSVNNETDKAWAYTIHVYQTEVAGGKEFVKTGTGEGVKVVSNLAIAYIADGFYTVSGFGTDADSINEDVVIKVVATEVSSANVGVLEIRDITGGTGETASKATAFIQSNLVDGVRDEIMAGKVAIEGTYYQVDSGVVWFSAIGDSMGTYKSNDSSTTSGQFNIVSGHSEYEMEFTLDNAKSGSNNLSIYSVKALYYATGDDVADKTSLLAVAPATA